MSGPAIAGLTIGDAPETWVALGFEIKEARCMVGATELNFVPGHGILSWTLTGSGPALLAGIPTTWTSGHDEAPGRHPNGAEAVDHVVLRTPDIDQTFAELTAAGMRLRRERQTEIGGRQARQGFFRHGEAILEVVGPAPGEPSLWGLTLIVADLDASAALLGDRLGDVHDAVQPGRRIATVTRAAGLSVPLALMSPDRKES